LRSIRPRRSANVARRHLTTEQIAMSVATGGANKTLRPASLKQKRRSTIQALALYVADSIKQRLGHPV
jgi:hypothetical protein